MEENKESRIDIDPDYSSDSFVIFTSHWAISDLYHLEKEKGDIACDLLEITWLYSALKSNNM